MSGTNAGLSELNLFGSIVSNFFRLAGSVFSIGVCNPNDMKFAYLVLQSETNDLSLGPHLSLSTLENQFSV